MNSEAWRNVGSPHARASAPISPELVFVDPELAAPRRRQSALRPQSALGVRFVSTGSNVVLTQKPRRRASWLRGRQAVVPDSRRSVRGAARCSCADHGRVAGPPCRVPIVRGEVSISASEKSVSPRSSAVERNVGDSAALPTTTSRPSPESRAEPARHRRGGLRTAILGETAARCGAQDPGGGGPLPLRQAAAGAHRRRHRARSEQLQPRCRVSGTSAFLCVLRSPEAGPDPRPLSTGSQRLERVLLVSLDRCAEPDPPTTWRIVCSTVESTRDQSNRAAERVDQDV